MTDAGKRYLRQSGPPILRDGEWIKPKAAIVLCDEPGCTAPGSFRRGWVNGRQGEAWCRTHLPLNYWETSDPHTASSTTQETDDAQRDGSRDLLDGADVER